MQILLCPKCEIALGEPDANGNLDAICGRCEYHYRILNARLDGSFKINWGFYLNLAIGGTKRQRVRYWSGAVHTWAHGRLGQWVGLLVTVRHGVIEDLISVWTSGDSEVNVSYPGRRARGVAAIGSFAAVILVLIVGGFSWAALTSAIVAGATAYWGIAKLRTARVPLDEDLRTERRAMQALLQRKLDFRRAAVHASNEAARKTEVAEHLSNLTDNMGAVDQALYADRIERLKRGALILVNQSNAQLRLAEGYRQAMRKIDIEMQSRHAARLLGQELPLIITQDEGLEALEEEIKRLDLELAANEEIEQMLAKSPQPTTKHALASDDEVPPIPLERVFDDLDEQRDWDRPDP